VYIVDRFRIVLHPNHLYESERWKLTFIQLGTSTISLFRQ